MMEGSPSAGAVVSAASFHHLSEASRLFQQSSYQTPGVVSPYGQHLSGHSGAGPPNAAGVPSPRCVLPQLPHGLSSASQSLAAALFATSPLIGDDLKLAAAAAAAAAAAQSRGKKSHRAEPVPQSGFKGVSWNSRMKAWLAFYVTENGERKSKTFSTRKLGMEEARLQAIAFCKQKQDQRREARKRNRGLQGQHCGGDLIGGLVNGNLDKLSSDESMLGSPASLQQHHGVQHCTMRCGYPTTPGTNITPAMMTPGIATSQGSNNSEIAYVPIVPIAVDMIEKSGLLQPLELTVLPPCQHCNKQPYPFLMIVSEGQEQTYSGSSIMSLASHNVSASSTGGGGPAPPSPSEAPSASVGSSGGLPHDGGSPRSSDGITTPSTNGMFNFNV